MRTPAAVLASAALAVLAAGVWALGCADLSGNCELEVNCKPVAPPPMCAGVYPSGPCGTCAEASCCQELSDCRNDIDGLACLQGVWPSGSYCTVEPTKTAFTAIVACLKAKCSPACDAADTCNPVTLAGCAMAGMECDANYPGDVTCLPPFGPTVMLCDSCDSDAGPYCGRGARCFAGTHQCAQFCCTDADCGTGNTCVTDPVIVFGVPLKTKTKDAVGLCMVTGGKTPACTVAPKQTSNGTCFAGFPAQ